MSGVGGWLDKVKEFIKGQPDQADPGPDTLEEEPQPIPAPVPEPELVTPSEPVPAPVPEPAPAPAPEPEPEPAPFGDEAPPSGDEPL